MTARCCSRLEEVNGVIILRHLLNKFTAELRADFFGDEVPEGSHSPLVFDVIDQTRGRVFPPISKHREVGWKNEAQPSFFNQLRGVWK